MILYLIRHGRQESDRCNVDVPLSEEGRRQAELLGRRMAEYPVDALYTSHLLRAEQTGRIAFSHRRDLTENMQIRRGLAEIDFGRLTGREDSKVKAFYREYYQEQKALFQDKKNRPAGTALDRVNAYVGEYFVPPEEMWYPGGENGGMVLERVMPVVREWIDSPYQNIAVVSHGGVIRILLCALFGGDFGKRLMYGTSLENCSITQLHFDEKLGGFFLDRFNDYAHIEAEPALLRSNYVKPNE